MNAKQNKIFGDKKMLMTKEELCRYPVRWLQNYKKELNKKISKLNKDRRDSLNELLRQRSRIVKALNSRGDVR